MPNVKVNLFKGSEEIKDKTKGFLQTFETDQSGEYRFMNIPPGDYFVLAIYSENQQKFNVEPSVHKVQIENKSAQVPPFSIIGFSIFGKAVNHKGEGIGGVKIIIDG